MKALSLWQPWASLWLSPAKVHETREWKTDYRGPLLVHAAKRIAVCVDPRLDEICVRKFGESWRKTLPRGALIGRIQLVSMISTNEYGPSVTCSNYTCGNWAPDRWGWQRDDHYDLFRHPIPYKGLQKLFNVPDDPL